jgi:hypothetical protein
MSIRPDADAEQVRSVSERPEIALIHLVRVGYGAEPFQRFVQSYRAHRAGAEHELVLLCKGFERDELPSDWKAALGPTDATLVFRPDSGMDISSYFEVSETLGHRQLCFLNSWSRILADDWLAKLHRHAISPGVGVVGATGAWFSLYTANVIHFRQQSASRAESTIESESQFDVLRPYFPPFPNPYIRSNGFLIERSLFLSLRGTGETKIEALLFEMGADSMTRQVMARDLKALVVGRDGRAYEADAWPASRTFRSGDQENLLVSDNRTEMYASADGLTRQSLAWSTWGEAAHDDAPTPMDKLGPLELGRIPPGLRISLG